MVSLLVSSAQSQRLSATVTTLDGATYEVRSIRGIDELVDESPGVLVYRSGGRRSLDRVRGFPLMVGPIALEIPFDRIEEVNIPNGPLYRMDFGRPLEAVRVTLTDGQVIDGGIAALPGRTPIAYLKIEGQKVIEGYPGEFSYFISRNRRGQEKMIERLIFESDTSKSLATITARATYNTGETIEIRQFKIVRGGGAMASSTHTFP